MSISDLEDPKYLKQNCGLNYTLVNKMSNWPEITRYSKKSVFLSFPEDREVFLWAVETIHHLGGIDGFHEGEKGWILPGNQEEKFRAQYAMFKEKQAKFPRTRRSRDPDKKRKRSRVFVRADQNSANHSQFPERRSSPVDLEDKKEETEKKISSLKPVSYINWEVSSNKQEETLSEDEKNNDESDEENQDDESSDDELIQTVLARKMKNESSGKLIDTENINDSDEEDCVSYSRRLRHIYAVMGNLRSRVAELESKLAKHD